MSNSIDQRVVEMKFENEQFERGVSRTLKSLDSLKKGLDLGNALNGLQVLSTIGSKLQLNKIGTGVDFIASRFNILGIASQKMKEKFVDAVLDIPTKLATTIADMSSFGNMADGFTKFGDKTRSVGTMISQGFDISDVNEQIDKLAWFADETSYSLVDMTSNIAKFTATGQSLEDSSDAMQGIALWAALSGQGAQQASSAMYQLSQALGAGLMRKEDYKSIQNLSMDTDEFRQIALDTAVAIGTLEKTSDGFYKSTVADTDAFEKSQFADHLTKDAWLTTDVMMAIYRKYSSAVNQIYDYTEEHGVTASQAIEELGDTVDAFGMKAFKAGQEARTWQDVVDSVKDAVSSQWMKSWELIFGDYEKAKDLWTDLSNELWDVFAAGGEHRNERLADLLSSKWDEFVKTIKDAGVDQAEFEDALKETYRQHGIAIDEVIEKYGSLERAVQQFPDASKYVSETLRNMGSDVSETFEEAGLSAAKLQELVDRIMHGDFGNGRAVRAAAFAKEGLDNYETVQEAVNELVWTGKITFEKYTEEQLRSAGATEEQVKVLMELAEQAEATGTPLKELIDAMSSRPSGRDLLVESFWNSFHALVDTIDLVKESFRTIFPEKTTEQLYAILERVHEFTERLSITAEKASLLKRNFSGLFASLDILKQVFQAIGKSILKVVKHFSPKGGLLHGLLSFTAGIGDSVVAFDEWLKETNFVDRASDKISDGIINAVTKVKDAAGSVTDFVKNAYQKIKPYVTSAIDWVKNAAPKVTSSVRGVLSGVRPFARLIMTWIKDLAPKAAEGIKNLFTQISPIFGEGIDFIKQKLGIMSDGESGSSFISSISKWKDKIIEVIANAWDSIKSAFSGGRNDFTTSVVPINTSINDALDIGESSGFSVGDALVSISDKLTIVFDKLKEIWPKIQGMVDNFRQIFKAIFGGLTFVGKKIKEADLDQDSIESAVGLGLDIARFQLLKGLFKTVKDTLDTIGKSFKSIGDFKKLLVDSIKNTVGAVTATMKEYQNTLKAKKLLTLAEAIGILVLAVIALTLVDQKKLFGAVTVITILMTEIALMAKAFETMDFGKIFSYEKGAGFSANAGVFGALIGLAAAMFVVAGVIKKLGSMDQGELINGIVGMTAIMIALVAAIKIMQMSFSGSGVGGPAGIMSFESDSSGMLKAVVAMIAMAFAIKKLAGAVAEIGALSWQDGLKGTLAVMGLMVTLGWTMNNTKVDVTKGLAFTAMAAAVRIAASAVAILAELPPESCKQGVNAIKTIAIIFGVFASIGGALPNTDKVGAAFAGIGLAMLMMVGVIKLLAKENPDNILKALFAMGVGLSEIGLALAFLPKDASWAGKSILQIALAMLILAPAMKILGTLSWGEVLVALVAMAGALAVFGGVALALTPVSGVMMKISKSMLLFGAGLVAVGIALPLLAAGILLIFPSLMALIGALRLAIPAFVDLVVFLIIELSHAIVESAGTIIEDAIVLIDMVLQAIREYIRPVCDNLLDIVIEILESLGERTPELLSAIGLVLDGIAGAVLDALKSMDWEKTGALVGAFGGFALIFKILGKMKENLKDSLIVAGSIILCMGLIAAIFYALKDVDGENMLVQAEALVLGLGAIAAVTVVVAKIKANAAAAIEAIKVLDLVFVDIVALLAIFGGLRELIGGDNVDKILDSGIRIFGFVGEAIGALVGGLGLGVIDMIAIGIERLGTALGNFATNSGSFFTAATEMTPTTAEGVKTVAEALLAFTKAELMDGLANFLGADLDLVSFGEELEAFGPHLKAFAESVDGLDDGDVEIAANAAKMVAEFAKDIPNSGGVLGWIMGENDLGYFGEQLKAFGPALKQFGEDTDGLNSEAVEQAAAAADMINKFANDVPNTGGALAWIMGDNDLTHFGEQLKKFGPALKQFGDDTDGLNSDAVEQAAAAADMVIAFSKEVPDSGGLLALIAGDNKIDDFGADLLEFGKGLKGYSDLAVLLNIPKISDSITAAGDLIDLGDKAPDASETWNLNSLGGRLAGGEGYGTSFGEQLVAYSGYVESCDWTKINSATTAIKLLCDKVTSLGPDGVEAIKKFGEGLSGLSQFTVDEFVAAIEAASDTVEAAGTSMMTSFLTGLGSDTLPSESEAYSIMSDIIDAIEELLSSEVTLTGMSTTAKNLVAKFNEGLKTAKDLFKLTFASAITGLKVSLRDSYESFVALGQTFARKFCEGFKSNYTALYDAGEYAVKGLINGMKNKATDVYSTSFDIAKTADRGMKNGLQEKSPSKLTYRTGVFAALGLINALKDNLGNVYSAGQDVSNSALDGVRGAISNIASVLDDEVDTQPVIRPILDDSELQNGVRGISSLFNSGSSYALRGAASLSGRFSAKNITLDANGNPLGTNVTFNQYNSSPKALNRLEIYRQTRNLLGSTRARVGAV